MNNLSHVISLFQQANAIYQKMKDSKDGITPSLLSVMVNKTHVISLTTVDVGETQTIFILKLNAKMRVKVYLRNIIKLFGSTKLF